MTVHQVLDQYGMTVEPSRIVDHGNAGGFSGAGLWQIQADDQSLCLRRWPRSHPDQQRLTLIHRALQVAQQAGMRTLPVPLTNRAGATFCSTDSCYWELTRWMPGRADFHDDPNDARLTAAMRELARFHVATGVASGVATGMASSVATRNTEKKLQPDSATASEAIPRSILQRIAFLEQLQQGELQTIRRAVQSASQQPVGNATMRLLSEQRFAGQLLELACDLLPHAHRRISEVATLSVPVQICIRDIQHDHVFFEQNSVSGIVDFGSMDFDNVATDIARLCGSLIGDDEDCWRNAISAYLAVRPMNESEKCLVPILDESSVILSGLNWLNWIFVEKRVFDDATLIHRRLQTLWQRLLTLEARKV